MDFIDPDTKETLVRQGTVLTNGRTGAVVAHIVNGLPRFVPYKEDEDDSFGFQWNKWRDIRSESRNGDFGLKRTILERTKFDSYNLEGKTLLECGMGGGDDTEVLLGFPLAELHCFDVSNSVDRAAELLRDPRLTLFQASIFCIPYPERSFDIVYCHRVLQHTPDPVAALMSVCNMVKVGGILFAHAYKRSRKHMAEWRYKYRWLTKRLPRRFVEAYVERCGNTMHALNRILYKTRSGRKFAYRFVPFYYKEGDDVACMSESSLVELEKLITFDALAPAHDHPMSPKEFFGTIEEEGFEIEHRHDPSGSPMFCTAVRRR